MTTSEDQTLLSFLFKPNSSKKDKTTVDKPWGWRNYLLVGVVLVLAVFLVYLNSLANEAVSDDKGLAVEGQNLLNPAFIFSDPFGALRVVYYGLIYLTCDLAPSCLRLGNIFFQGGNAVLVFILISLFTRKTIAFFTALIFAVHPLLTEGVTWISGGGYVQYTFFFLLSFITYILSVRSEGKKSRNYYLLSLVFFVIMLFTTNRLFMAPVFVLYEFVFGDVKKNWKKLIPFVLGGLVWLGWYLFQFGSRTSSLVTQTYAQEGAINPLVKIPYALTSYLELIFWPQKLSFYQTNPLSTLVLTWKWVGFLVFSGLLVYGKAKNKQLFFWLSFFLIGLILSLTPFKISVLLAERYAYIATLGIIFLAVYGTFYAFRKQERVLWVLLVILVVVLGVRTLVRNLDWKNTDTLMLAVIKTHPTSPRAQNNVGVYYYNQKDIQKAEEHFLASIQANPRFLEAYRNLIILYVQTGRKDKAVELVSSGLKANPSSDLLMALRKELE